MINLHKDNSPRARYEASYLSWLHLVFTNMFRIGWTCPPKKNNTERLREALDALVTFAGIAIITSLFPISVPIIALIGMIGERRKFVRYWGKHTTETNKRADQNA